MVLDAWFETFNLDDHDEDRLGPTAVEMIDGCLNRAQQELVPAVPNVTARPFPFDLRLVR